MVSLTAKFNFVIPNELLNRLKAVAEKKNVSAASLLNSIISEYVDEIDENDERIAKLEKRIEALEKEVFKK